MATQQPKIIIIGAGPTGLSAACHLRERGYDNFVVYERTDYPGGLSASITDDYGFVWDLGGHVFISQYRSFFELIGRYLRQDLLEHVKKSWIRIYDSWVPYPFQENFVYLPKNIALDCFAGLEKKRDRKSSRLNFRAWIVQNLGQGIGRHFMFPYNRKLWSVPLETMDSAWVRDRISLVRVDEIMDRLNDGDYELFVGQNVTFQYPSFGGMGEMFRRMAGQVSPHIVYRSPVADIDSTDRKIILADGRTDHYDTLINTAPLDLFRKSSVFLQGKYRPHLDGLKHNSLQVVGIGIHKPCESDKCWVYFPEKKYPFYRITYLSNYSPHNTPDSQQYYSLLCEISCPRPVKPVSQPELIQRTIQGLIEAGIFSTADREAIVSTFTFHCPHAYPIPTLGRDTMLAELNCSLEKAGIYSRGRFGSWKYEIGNMDHCMLQGREVVDRILDGQKETIYF